MLERRTLPWRRLLAPAAAAAAIVTTAPVIRPLRDLLFTLLPRHAAPLLAATLGLLAVVALGVAVTRIRRRRRLRYAGLALVAVALWLQAVGLSQDLPPTIRTQVSLVERIHIVEYGGLALLLVVALRPLGLTSAACLAAIGATLVGVLDETVQYLVPSRTGEVRDVAINAAAAATGVLFALCVAPPPYRPGIGWLRPTLRAAGVLALMLGLFVAQAHVGHEIDDPEVGRFLSWHTADELLAAAGDRAVRWHRDQPPTGKELCCFQDYYLTEASRHNEHRTERYKAGDLVAAWHADNVLRKYFAPYLDKPLPPNGRLPRDEVDRAALERAAAEHRPAAYRSPVLRGRIWTTPGKAVWIAGAAGLAVLLLTASGLVPPRSHGSRAQGVMQSTPSSEPSSVRSTPPEQAGDAKSTRQRSP